MLSAQVVFETDKTLPDQRKDIENIASDFLIAALNALAVATKTKLVMRMLRRLVDWTPGLGERQGVIYTEKPEWDMAEPELNEAYIVTAERLLTMQAGQAHQAAMRWHRIALQESDFRAAILVILDSHWKSLPRH